jgi:hypothetical protein
MEKSQKEKKQSRSGAPPIPSGSKNRLEKSPKEGSFGQLSLGRLSSLRGITSQLIEALREDKLLEALGYDASTQDFIIERIKEIFEEAMSDEREAYIGRLEASLEDTQKKLEQLSRKHDLLGQKHEEALRRIEEFEEEQSSFSFRKSQTNESLGKIVKGKELQKELEQMDSLLVIKLALTFMSLVYNGGRKKQKRGTKLKLGRSRPITKDFLNPKWHPSKKK